MAAALLGGCATRPQLPLVAANESNPANAYAWDLSGKILIKTPQDKASTNLYWLHSPKLEQLQLTSMLGTSVLSMTITPQLTRIETGGHTYQAKQPGPLLQQLTGWNIPLQLLPLWVTGQFEQTTVIRRDAHQRPAELISTDNWPWHIKVGSWQQDNPRLPRTLLLRRGDLSLKIQINRWQALAPDTKA
ncbi:outer-membrane lipoprotein LolB [Shewanella sp. NFH-SH190041]|nr:outer-membrane lipoprotein LolB [Shewanella sp. NFH-SH190041]